MKGWKLTKPLTIEEQEILEDNVVGNNAKIKITKCLVTFSDLLRYTGETEAKDVVLGSFGIGIVSETDANLFGLEKGKHVYIVSKKPCQECFNCMNTEINKCSNMQVAGEDFDGFLRDFASAESDMLYVLPESVSDYHALFIGYISKAVSIIDKLGIKKGEYVSIIGANNFGIILAQLLIYYQAVPILMTTNDEDLKIAKDSHIYYCLGQDDNWQKEVASITSGRMTDKVVYISECNIPVTKAFSLASFNAGVAITGVYKTSPVSFSLATKKQLDIHCINGGLENASTSINIIANKAIDFSHLKLNTATYEEVPELFKKLNEEMETKGKIYETIVELYK